MSLLCLSKKNTADIMLRKNNFNKKARSEIPNGLGKKHNIIEQVIFH